MGNSSTLLVTKKHLKSYQKVRQWHQEPWADNLRQQQLKLITFQSCDFYPKYHCELKFIEQYWGAAKLIYRTSPKTKDMKDMEENVKNSLEDVPIVQIQQVLFPIQLFLTNLINQLSKLSHNSQVLTDKV
jgi:hypothetical protein